MRYVDKLLMVNNKYKSNSSVLVPVNLGQSLVGYPCKQIQVQMFLHVSSVPVDIVTQICARVCSPAVVLLRLFFFLSGLLVVKDPLLTVVLSHIPVPTGD